jgi:hypothetical protein
MSTERDYEILFQLNTSPYVETASWVLPNTFKSTFENEKKPEFVIDDILKKVPFIKDGLFPQYK